MAERNALATQNTLLDKPAVAPNAESASEGCCVVSRCSIEL
jgi:hypothetical protein